MIQLPTLSALPKESLLGKRVLVRADINVPIKDGRVTDAFRIKAALPTITLLRDAGARVLIIAHLGRKPDETLAPVWAALNMFVPAQFHPDILASDVPQRIEAMANGDVLMFDNIRRYSEEESNDATFAQHLASLADLYVNDAFSAAHRAHASIVGIPRYVPHVAGIQLAQEVSELSKGLSPAPPALFIVGGAKFETKLPIMRMALTTYDHVFVGGALAHDVLKARGVSIGRSLSSETIPQELEQIACHEKLVAPVDAVVRDAEGNTAIRLIRDIRDTDTIYDIGPSSVRSLATLVKRASSILWNGPLGYYEGGFGGATEAIAELVASRTDAVSLVGGGDTIAAINKLGLEKSFTFLSTGGGAMLDFLADGTLVGIDALLQS